MKNPNSYGSVVNMGPGRRKPYAVRVTTGMKCLENGKIIQERKYIGYYESRKQAITALAEWNKNKKLPEHEKYIDLPTFKEVYDKMLTEKKSLKKKPSKSTIDCYNAAFRRFESIHSMKMCNVTATNLQNIITSANNMSKTTVKYLKILLNAMCQYCIRNYIECEDRMVEKLIFEFSDDTFTEHRPFTEDEINTIWKSKEKRNVDIVLIFLYTGLRCSEFLGLKTKDIFLNERYMIGGLKTEAGKNRVIPLCDKVFDLVKAYYNPKKEFLFEYRDKQMSYNLFLETVWNDVMSSLEMNHLPHDTRHTFITALKHNKVDDAIVKKIVGHSLGGDITNSVYNHISLEDMLEAVNTL